ncbi:MAG: hypothetical protein H2069_01735 [Legionella sp.]|nr:hypothetical protein [Legionella sp.]
MTQNWRRLAAVQFGLAVGLPPILVGYILFLTYGLVSAIVSIMCGSLILFCLAIISMSLALKKPLSTIECAEIFLGKKGMLICGIAMGISLFGWFTINLSFISVSISKLLGVLHVPHSELSILVNLILGITATLIVIKDIHSIGTFALLNFPIIISIIAYSFFILPNLGTSELFYGEKITCAGIPLVLASNLAIIIDLPTYYRFARTKKDALISTSLTFMLFIPAITMVGAVFAFFIAGRPVVNVIAQAGGTIGVVLMVFFLTISNCMINNGNIYSCDIALRPFTRNFSRKKTLVFLGIMGSTLSCFDIITRFTFWLDGINILIGSMGAVILTSFFFDKFKLSPYSTIVQSANCLSLLLGSLFGILTWNKYIPPISGFAFLDAAMTASISTLLFRSASVYVSLFKKSTR